MTSFSYDSIDSVFNFRSLKLNIFTAHDIFIFSFFIYIPLLVVLIEKIYQSVQKVIITFSNFSECLLNSLLRFILFSLFSRCWKFGKISLCLINYFSENSEKKILITCHTIQAQAKPKAKQQPSTTFYTA